jgi:hypothetical protein
MHYHIEFSSSGFDAARFESYEEAFEAAQNAVQRAQPLASPDAIQVRPNETFKVEVFDYICPVCLRSANRQRAWRFAQPLAWKIAATIEFRRLRGFAMHYHIDWSSTGFGSEGFDSYADAYEAAHSVVEGNSPTSRTRTMPIANETFKIEKFDDSCPVCARFKVARAGA